MRRAFICIFLVGTLWCYESKGQSATTSFPTLSLPVSAEISGVSGMNVSDYRLSVAQFQNNPSLSVDSLDGRLSVSHLFYFAGVGLSSFAFQNNFGSIGSLSFGVSHLSLGDVDGYDLFGTPTGSFDSGETVLAVGKSHQVSQFRFGVSLKGAFSNLAGYRASSMSLDLGGVFIHPQKDFSVGLVIKNVGIVTKEFSPTSSSSIPFDVQAGLTYKPEHMPLRFSATVYHLAEYNSPYEVDVADPPGTLDKLLSHLTFGGELLVHKNVSVLLGYNFLRHKELKLEGAGGGAGFSIGALAKVNRFSFSFSRSGYVAGGAYQVSLNIDTKKLITRK